MAADAPFHSLVQRAGFVHERVVLRMWRMLDEAIAAPTWVAGVSVRTYDDRDGRAVKALLDDAYALGRALHAAVVRRVARAT